MYKSSNYTSTLWPTCPRNAPISPWSEVHVDSIGPWTIQFRNGVAIYHDATMESSHPKPSDPTTIPLSFDALTCIDPITNLLEIYHYPGNKTASEAAHLFENHWLSRYPRPSHCVHDNGPKFVGHDFQFMLSYAGIAPVTISPNMPTSNSIIEAIHKAIGQSICTTIHLKPLTTALRRNTSLTKQSLLPCPPAAAPLILCLATIPLALWSFNTTCFLTFPSSPISSLLPAIAKLQSIIIFFVPTAIGSNMNSRLVNKFMFVRSANTLVLILFFKFTPTTLLLSNAALFMNLLVFGISSLPFIHQHPLLIPLSSLEIPWLGRVSNASRLPLQCHQVLFESLLPKDISHFC